MQVDDGNSRAAYPAAVEILKQLGVLEKKTSWLSWNHSAARCNTTIEEKRQV